MGLARALMAFWHGSGTGKNSSIALARDWHGVEWE